MAIVTCGNIRMIELVRTRSWCADVNFIDAVPDKPDHCLPRGHIVVQSLDRDPFDWVSSQLPTFLEPIVSGSLREGWNEALVGIAANTIATEARKSALNAFSHRKDDILAARIRDCLNRVTEQPGSALGWYCRHYATRAILFERGAEAHFSVGEAVWDDDWVFHVCCELQTRDIDPYDALIVLVCANPLDYYKTAPDEARLEWLGAVSGDIVHFIWMVDRHGKPSMKTQDEIVTALRAANIRVPDDALLLVMTTLRRSIDSDGDIIADVQGVIPIVGRLDTDDAREMFSTIIETVKAGRTKQKNAAAIVSDLRYELAAMRTIQKTHALELFKRVLEKFFGRSEKKE